MNGAKPQVRPYCTLGAEPDIAAWMNDCALNAVRVEPSRRQDPEVQAVAGRLARHTKPGLARMAELAGDPDPALLTRQPTSAVVGSMMVATRSIESQGNPPLVACSRTAATLSAM